MWSDKQQICFYSIGTCGGTNRRSLRYLRNAVGRSADLYWDTLRDHIIQYIKYHNVCPVVGIGSPQHLPRKPVCLPPKNQFRRWDRNSGTLCSVYYNPFTQGHVEGRAANTVSTLDTWSGTADFYLGNAMGEHLRREQLYL